MGVGPRNFWHLLIGAITLAFPCMLSQLPQAVPGLSTTGGDMIYSACLYLFQGNINAVLTGFINIDKISRETQGVCYPLAIVQRVTVSVLT